jgi:nucleotide-binding universal stress UspA family protein
MNTILLATDYSPVAQNAAVYALHLAHHLQADLELVHSYIIPFAYTDSPVPLLNIDEIQKIAEDSMEAKIRQLQQLNTYGVRISHKIIAGDIIECLEEVIKEQPPLLVVMGTYGAGSDSFLWGSVAVKALRTLKAPVLAIPAEANWQPVRKIGFSADYQQISEQTPVTEIMIWLNQMDATLEVIHVDKPEQLFPVPALLTEQLQDLRPVYHSLIHEHIEDAVAEFILNHKIDWLLVIPKKHGFFENLFHKSRTKGIAQTSNVPVLALHQE